MRHKRERACHLRTALGKDKDRVAPAESPGQRDRHEILRQTTFQRSEVVGRSSSRTSKISNTTTTRIKRKIKTSRLQQLVLMARTAAGTRRVGAIRRV